MASPAYLSITDEQGAKVTADVAINGREGTAEIIAFDYDVSIPSDKNTGALTAVRKHNTATMTKTYDSASPVLFDACCRGKTFKQMVLHWYKISNSGSEVEYFRHTLTNVKVVKVRHFVQNVKDPHFDALGHQEQVSVRFQKIEMSHPDGNIHASDDWTESRA